MTKKVLLTGASGFLGGAVLKKLIENDFAVLALSLSPLGKTHPRVKWVECDLTRVETARKVSPLFAGIQYVVHTAARMPQGGALNNLELLADNLKITVNLLEFLPPGIKQLIYCSSVDVYGLNSKAAVDESCLTRPVNIYGIAKLLGEHLSRVRFQKKAVVTSLRFSHLYGPGEPRIKIIPRLIDCILKGEKIQIENQGHDSRDYLFVEDAAEAVIACLKKPLSGVFNVSGAKRTTVRTVIRILERVSGEKLKVRYLPVKKLSHSVFANQKFASLSGWKPRITISEGLKRQYELCKRGIN
ncbi:MAG: NAD-dependent epimerase/dehydratase family protein [Candidatus Omnitrophica bacterium]|nr:NAD-dependent epimerase/dehydratase family protein [Candidatus Omnitrophota bacterium]